MLTSEKYLSNSLREVNSFYQLRNIKSFSWNEIDTSVPVVILKMEHYESLGIIRSLGRLGIKVYGVDKNMKNLSAESRYCQGSYCFDVEDFPEHDALGFLDKLSVWLRNKTILVPTSDETALFVARNAEILKEKFIFPDPGRSLVESLCSKKDMYLLAKRHNIPVPETFFPKDINGVINYGENITYPVMLKGINGGEFEKSTGEKMIIIRDKTELIKTYISLSLPDQQNIMLQEFIPHHQSSMWIFNGYFDSSSNCLAAFTGLKLRQNPIHTGMTSLGLCQWNKTLSDLSTFFMKSINYKGIVDIDYLFDSRDGNYKIVDINPRIGASFRLFVGQNGEDVIRTMYLDLTSQQPSFSFPRNGRKWLVEDKDLYSSYKYFKENKIRISDWLTSFVGVKEAGYFAADDPKPSVMLWINHVKKTMRKMFNNKNVKKRKSVLWQKLL